jgi:hypothetical protein
VNGAAEGLTASEFARQYYEHVDDATITFVWPARPGCEPYTLTLTNSAARREVHRDDRFVREMEAAERHRERQAPTPRDVKAEIEMLAADIETVLQIERKVAADGNPGLGDGECDGILGEMRFRLAQLEREIAENPRS